MQFLADENFPGEAVMALQTSGEDIVWVRTAAPGMADRAILQWALRESRIILTFDKDFGELAWRDKLPATCGIMLFRIKLAPQNGFAGMIVATIKSRNDWIGHFSVIESGRTRMRSLDPPNAG